MDRTMPKSLFLGRKWIWLALAAGLALCPTPAPAQLQIPASAISDQEGRQVVLHQGELLESERRWEDAIEHYESALKRHPEWQELRQRLVMVRTHMDIARRYSDRSFTASLGRLTRDQALDLYSEVLLKIDTYHVDAPQWGELLRRGVLNLEIASTEPAFVERFPRPEGPEPGREFARDVQGTIDFDRIYSRRQAQDAADSITSIAVADLRIVPQAAVLEFACAAVQSLDHYSAFLTGDQLDEVFAQIEGSFVGLGIELKADNNTLLIVNVIPGGPAAEAGIAANDRIIEVDGKTTREVSTDAAADMLKGPELSYVEIVLQSPDGTVRRERVQRRRVDVPSVQEVSMADPANGIAYMKLTSFQKTTSRDVDRALWSLHRQGMRALIIDVRNNPGGLLNSSVEIADKFLASGTIVSTRGRSVREDFDYPAHSVGTWRVPLVVLIDGDSASAAEIFAGAIRDHGRGTVVGQRSYGKGSVQGIFPLTRYKAGLRLTTAKFYSPSGRAISHRGIDPDVLVAGGSRHMVARPTDQGLIAGTQADPILQAGLDVARQSATYHAGRAQ